MTQNKTINSQREKKEIKLFSLPIVCSPKIIEYYAEDKEDAINLFLEENPAFDKSDIYTYDIKEVTSNGK